MLDASLALQMIVRLLITAGLGGIVGYEREKKGKAAGIRTHMLVCLGTSASAYLFNISKYVSHNTPSI